MGFLGHMLPSCPCCAPAFRRGVLDFPKGNSAHTATPLHPRETNKRHYPLLWSGCRHCRVRRNAGRLVLTLGLAVLTLGLVLMLQLGPEVAGEAEAAGHHLMGLPRNTSPGSGRSPIARAAHRRGAYFRDASRKLHARSIARCKAGR